MDDETTRLRALLKGIALPWKAQPTVVDGDEVECLALVLCPHGDDGDRDMVAEIDMGHGVECDDAHAALIVAAVNALPGLLDAAERAERAERERDDLAATLETRTAEHALAMARVAELESALARADHAASMACLSPPDGCDCAGCAFAAEMGGDRGE